MLRTAVADKVMKTFSTRLKTFCFDCIIIAFVEINGVISTDLNLQRSDTLEDKAVEDEVIKCRDCNSTFKFTVAEQTFYKEKGFKKE